MHEQFGKHADAITSFDEAIRLNPKVDVVYYNRAMSYKALGNNDKSVEDLRKVIEITSIPQLRSDAEQRLKELGW